MAFTTPEKKFPAEFYEKLTWAPKAVRRVRPRALFPTGDQSPTSSIHPQKLFECEPCESNLEQLESPSPPSPPSPPRKPLSLKFYEQLLQAPKRPVLANKKNSGRYSLPASSNITNKPFHNRSCITFST